MSTYKFRPGFRLGVDAKVVGDELSRIDRKFGGISQEAVVTEAAKRSNPLHDEFDWDDRSAAHKHRLERAAYIIRSVCEVPVQDSRPVRSFVSIINPDVADDRVGSYVPIARAMTDPDMRSILLRQAMRELEAFEAKYSTLSELAAFMRAVRAVRSELAATVTDEARV